MFEHVGAERIGEYFGTLHALLADTGRLLNHAISGVGGSRMARDSFIGRYVFPDGELIDVGEVVLGMERAGFEVRDVESLREHYARHCGLGSRNLETNWDTAVAEVGVQRARVWHLYMAASANGFEDGGNLAAPGARGQDRSEWRELHAAHQEGLGLRPKTRARFS